MLTFSELKSKCKEAIADTPVDISEESVSVLCQNEWVRILTVYDPDTVGSWRIEVEVSLPSQMDFEPRTGVKDFIQNLIKHLEYLLRLNDEGLTLSVMSRDGLWTAYIEIENLPPDKLFKALIPPYL